MSRVALAAPLVGLLLVAGCSDDSPDPRIAPTPSDTTSAASTSSPDPDPTPTGPVEPTLPPEAEGTDAAAAEAFVRHFWEMVNYAQATGDVQPLNGLALQSCESCVSGANWIADVYAAGGHIEGGGYTVKRLKTRPLAAGDLRLFEVESTVSTTDQLVRGAGALNQSFPGELGVIDVTVVVSAGELRVSDWESS